MRVAIVGSGIVGAWIALELSARHRVTIVDAAPQAGAGASGRSFGWINHIHCDPEGESAEFDRRLAARDRFDRMNDRLGGALFAAGSGSLVWGVTDGATEAMANPHLARGAPSRLIGRDEIERIAPHVAWPPALALHSPRDVALSAGFAAGLMAQAAAENGARMLMGHTVLGVEVAQGRATGLRLAETVIAADVVVLAAGTNIPRLLPDPGALRIGSSPAGLVRLAATGPAPAVILDTPKVEIRPAGPGYWLSAVDLDGSGPQMSLDDIAARVRADAIALMPGLRDLRVTATAAAARPMPEGGLIAGPVPGVEGLFAAVSHPGVINAPFLSDRIAALLDS